MDPTAKDEGSVLLLGIGLAFVCLLALAVMAALYAFTACYQIRPEAP